MSKIIQGAGGGGGKSGGGSSARAPVEARDSLRSKAFAKVLDLVCEGEVEGLVDGLKSVYLNGTPIQNDDGSYNFQGVEMTARTGTQAQGYIPGFPAVESTVNVGAQVSASVPVTRQITNANANVASVLIGIPQLSYQNPSTGDLSGTSVQIAIDLQSNGGGGFTEVLTDTITGKTTTRYQRTYQVPLTGSAPWDIRVRRVTADSGSVSLQNQTWFDAYTEVIEAKLRYPNSALVGLKVDSSQFQNIPTRGYDMKLLRVKVPSNYNPTTRAYTGSWDGNFVIAWTDNPAWCFYDLVTNDRYGLGGLVDEAQVDKWAMYTIGKYCDELVPDGFGGTELRFTCNMYLQTRQEAFKVLRDMASVFRGMVFWSTGSITASQDAPADPVALFTGANVVGGAFAYQGSSLKARHTVALVTWNDPADLYRQKVEYVEDLDGIARYGVQQTEVVAVGCTSRGQANRVGRWLLYSERAETEMVQFSVGLDGAVVRPGNIIKVADASRASARLGGRVSASTVNGITVDTAPGLAIAGWTLYATLPDGTVEARTIVSLTGNVIAVAPAFSAAPTPQGVWVVSGTTVEAQTFRVISLSENAGEGTYAVTALKHEPLKYAAIENGLVLQPRNYTLLSLVPSPPASVLVTDSLYRTSAGIRVRINVSWTAVQGATQYVVTYAPLDGNVSPPITTGGLDVDISDVTEGIYTVSVYAISVVGIRSASATQVQYQVLGKTTPPEDVQGFVVARNGNTLNLTWRHVSDIDLDHYEIRQGSSWSAAILAGATVSNMFSINAPRGGQFLIKAVDTSGNFSNLESSATVADISGINVLLETSEDARLWSGTVNNALVLADLTGVVLSGETPWESYTQTWDQYNQPWIYLDVPAAGSYDTAPIDIGYLATPVVSLEAIVQIFTNQPPWAYFTESWFYYSAPNWTWEGNVSGVGAAYELATSADNVTWSAWQTFTPGAYTFRYLKIRVNLSTEDSTVIPLLSSLIVRIDVPDRVLHFEDVTVPITGTSLLFTPAFVGVQTVQVTLQSSLSGDRFTVTGKTNSQVTIQCFDSAGAAKAGLVDVDVFGYGERY